MYYAVTHLTVYKYSDHVSDSVMQVRLQPRSDQSQRQVRFDLQISPAVKVQSHRDYLGNAIHTFDVPAPHRRLAIKSDAVVEVRECPEVPQSLPVSTWELLDRDNYDRDCYDMLMTGHYTEPTSLLMQFAHEIDWRRRDDPLSLLRELNAVIYNSFDYQQHVTKVDSPIDIALENRLGVCQDFAHIMIALTRQIGIPCRYVSGYLFHREDQLDRSDVDASHAWVEAWLPQLGWIGFDPTNNLMVGDRHIRVSIGSDYTEAAPTRGVFKGTAETKLEVRVQVSRLDELPDDSAELAPEIVMPHYEVQSQSQMQMQMQQQQ
ncbi:MAG: transglutaminase family protein [Anaerolineae bacterium]